MFETGRLRVRHFVDNDLDDFAALCADPAVMRFVGDGTTLDRADVARWIRICQEKYATRGYGTSAVMERETGAFVGYCGVVRPPDQDFDELIYVLHRRSWGKGYATEVGRAMLAHVFDVSTLSSISATIDPHNEQSKRVAARIGMVETPYSDDSVSYWVIGRPTGRLSSAP